MDHSRLTRAPTANSVPMNRQNATRDAVMAQNRVLVKVVSMENPPSVERGDIYSLADCALQPKNAASQHEY